MLVIPLFWKQNLLISVKQSCYSVGLGFLTIYNAFCVSDFSDKVTGLELKGVLIVSFCNTSPKTTVSSLLQSLNAHSPIYYGFSENVIFLILEPSKHDFSSNRLAGPSLTARIYSLP